MTSSFSVFEYSGLLPKQYLVNPDDEEVAPFEMITELRHPILCNFKCSRYYFLLTKEWVKKKEMLRTEGGLMKYTALRNLLAMGSNFGNSYSLKQNFRSKF